MNLNRCKLTINTIYSFYQDCLFVGEQNFKKSRRLCEAFQIAEKYKK